MSEKKQTLYIDFDNSIVNSTKELVRLLNKKFNTNKNWLDVREYNCTDVFPNVKRENIIEAFDNKDFFTELQFFPNVLSTLETFKNDFNYVIVTIGTKDNLSHKKTFLRDNFPLNYDFYGIEKLDMGKGCLDMSDGIIIDDHIDNLRTSNARFKLLYKGDYDTSWNCQNWNKSGRRNEGFIEVRNWNDVRDKLWLLTVLKGSNLFDKLEFHKCV